MMGACSFFCVFVIFVFVSVVSMQDMPESLINQFQSMKSKVNAVPLITSHSDASDPSADSIPEATALNEKPNADPTESPKTVTEVISDDGYTRRIIHFAGDTNQEVQVFGDNSNATMRRTPNSLSVEAHNVL